MMLMRRLLSLLFAVLISVGSVPRGEAAWFCRTTGQRVPECCCMAASDPCAPSMEAAACGCCEREFTRAEEGEGSAPLVPRAGAQQIDPPAAGLPATSVAPISPALLESSTLAFSGPSPRSSPSLYLLHRVLRC